MLLSASLISKLGELVRNSKLVKQGELLEGYGSGRWLGEDPGFGVFPALQRKFLGASLKQITRSRELRRTESMQNAVVIFTSSFQYNLFCIL